MTLPKVFKRWRPSSLVQGCVLHHLQTLAVESMDLGRSRLSQSDQTREILWLIHLCATWSRDWSFLFSPLSKGQQAANRRYSLCTPDLTNAGNQRCMHRPLQTERNKAVSRTIHGSLLPYLLSWQLCWALAAIKLPLDPRTCWLRWEERHTLLCCPVLYKMLVGHRTSSRPACPSVLPPPNWAHITGISKYNF